MHLTTQLWLRLKTLFRRKQLDRDLQDEVAFHLAMREEKNRTDGITAGEERYAARRQFGNITQMKEATRELWTFASLESLWRDLTFALRTLSPGFYRQWDDRGRLLLQLLHCWTWSNLLFWALVPNHNVRYILPLGPGLMGLGVMGLLVRRRKTERK